MMIMLTVVHHFWQCMLANFVQCVFYPSIIYFSNTYFSLYSWLPTTAPIWHSPLVVMVIPSQLKISWILAKIPPIICFFVLIPRENCQLATHVSICVGGNLSSDFWKGGRDAEQSGSLTKLYTFIFDFIFIRSLTKTFL